MAVNRANKNISSKIDILIIIKGIMQLASPFIMVASIMAFIMFGQNFDILIHTNEYKNDNLKIDSVACSSFEYGSGQLCNGYGRVRDVLTFIYLGDEFEVDFDRKIYPVFYRPDGKLTLQRKEEEKVFDNTPYLKTAILQLGLPMLIMLLLFIYYKVLTKKIKRYEENKNSANSI